MKDEFKPSELKTYIEEDGTKVIEAYKDHRGNYEKIYKYDDGRLMLSVWMEDEDCMCDINLSEIIKVLKDNNLL